MADGLKIKLAFLPGNGVDHRPVCLIPARDRNAGKARSEEHTSELQSLMRISYAVFCLKKKTNNHNNSSEKMIHYHNLLHIKSLYFCQPTQKHTRHRCQYIRLMNHITVH